MKPGREAVEEIRRIHRCWAEMDWPDTIRLGHGRSADEQLRMWWHELCHRLRTMSDEQYARICEADLQHHLRTAERARRIAPRD